ncbi:flagellar protein [Lysinibacillus sphaericus]|uniref:Flagellar biosynthetic protein FliZ n=4 Tax=Bacillaceae TaxID=186817 RepID=A0A2S0K3S3_LYSSH|nr:flagellar protein [Lysinibacillus varians]AVK98001.1 flagellar protein [Lysinibacillus sphaericus]TKI48388.1 flagellar protein [Lysinibacillus tabacifolii]TKI18997.1 flagellar protein [Lysinibacillus sphaericus]TKI63426.1 flagellar protein [Lysinibacillus varians]
MQMLKSFRVTMIFAFLVTFLFVYPPTVSVHADTDTNSIEYCMKKPEECKENSDPAAKEDTVVSAAGDVSAWEYIKMVLALIFVVALFYGLMKFLNKRNLTFQRNQMVQNLGGLSLGAQKSVQLLQIGKTIYLVGVGEDVQLIREITDPQEVEELLALYNEKQEFAATSPYIAEVISKFKRKNKQNSSTSTQQDSFGELFEKKISEIKQERSEELERWKQKENDDK